MEAFKAHAPKTAGRARVRQAFSHLVVSDRVLDQLGPAINAGHSMFVYGPPGNGKTVISQAIHKLLDGDIHVPHALDMEGAIVRLFDPVDAPAGALGQHLDRPDAQRGGGRPLDPVPPAARDGRRRTVAGGTGAELQRSVRLLQGAGAGRGQRRASS